MKVALRCLKKHLFYTAFFILFTCWLGLQVVSVQTAWQLLAHKSSVHAETKNEQCTTLYFSLKEWQALSKPEPNELEYHGQRFDIQAVQILRNQVQVKGFYDTWETNWLTRHRSMHPNDIQPLWIAFFYFEAPFTIQVPIQSLGKPIAFIDSYAMPLLQGRGHDVVKPPAC